MYHFNGITYRIENSGGARARSASRIRRIENPRKSNTKCLHFDEVRISNKCQIEDLSFMRNPASISHIARRPVSGLWTLNYTTNSSTEAMVDGNIANVKYFECEIRNKSRTNRCVIFAINQNSLCEFSFRYYWKVRGLDHGGEQ